MAAGCSICGSRGRADQPDGGQRLRTPPNVALLCLWAWMGLLAALWASAEECCRFASGEGIICFVRVACYFPEL